MMARNTKQREAICRAFEATERPLSPEEVRAAAAQDIPQLGIATVYRTIRSLIEDHWLAEVALPGEPPRYERAGKSHHHHFRCRSCDKVYEIADCPRDVQKLAPPGFELEDHEITLFGRCAQCVSGRKTAGDGLGGRVPRTAGAHDHRH